MALDGRKRHVFSFGNGNLFHDQRRAAHPRDLPKQEEQKEVSGTAAAERAGGVK